MTRTKNPAAVALVLRRTFDAPREAVFDAWTNPSIMVQFLGENEEGCKDVQVDLRPGGAFRVVMVHSEDEDFVAVGHYREVVVPERVVCTWRWLEDDPKDEHETLLTLEFVAKGNQTELILTHENFRDAAQCESHERGWSAILDTYGKLIEGAA